MIAGAPAGYTAGEVVPMPAPISRPLSPRSLGLPLIVLALGAACSPKYAEAPKEEVGGAEGGDGGDGGGGDGSDGGATGPEDNFPVEAVIRGNITVELFGTDEDGERYPIDWASSGYDDWPFGPIFVANYSASDTDADGVSRYAGTRVLYNPEMGTTEYEMKVGLFEEGDVYAYAAIDMLDDGVVSTDDPRGVWPSPIPVQNGDEIEGIDILILTEARNEIICEDGREVTIKGEANVNVDYWGGHIAVMVMDSEGNGPFHVALAEDAPTGPGASTEYTLEVCADYGEMQLISCWDANLNGLHDPGDRWGVFSVDGNVDSNPIFVGSANLTNYPVYMPLGDRPGVDILPFVTMRGTLSLRDGLLSSLPTGSAAHVVALKYRPNTGFDPTQAGINFDIQSFTWSELSSATGPLDWSLTVPSETFVYLWAYADTDADGLVNERGEPIASGGSEVTGKVPTGTEGFGGILMELVTVEDEGSP